MKFIWENPDIRAGRRLFLKKLDVSKVSIGQLEDATDDRQFVLINEGIISKPYTVEELVSLLNENGSAPE